MKCYNLDGKVYSYAVDIYDYSNWLAGSCGARYIEKPTEKTDLKRIHNGIRIVNGHIQSPVKASAYTIDHIKTRNGPLTVGIRKKLHA